MIAKRRILFIFNTKFLPLDWSGASVCLHELTLALQGNGHEVRVLSARGTSDLLSLYHRARDKTKLDKGNVTYDSKNGYKCARVWDFDTAVESITKEWRPDAIIIAAGDVNEMEEKIRRYYTGNVGAYFQSVMRIEPKGFSPQTNSIYAVTSQFMLDLFREYHQGYHAPVGIIYPPVRAERCKTETSRAAALFVNPIEVKGRHIVFELAKLLPDINFHIYENWQLSNDDRSKLDDAKKLASNIKTFECVSDVRKMYSAARVVLIPSQIGEAWGLVATEAQQSGIPAIASNLGGLKESVGEGGVLIDPGADISIWAEGLREIWYDDNFFSIKSCAATTLGHRNEIHPNSAASHLIKIFLP